MIIDPAEILKEQIEKLEKDCEEFEFHIDELTRKSVSILVQSQAFADANLAWGADGQGDLGTLADQIRVLSGLRLEAMNKIKALRALQPKITQGAYPDWISGYIDGLRKFRVDL